MVMYLTQEIGDNLLKSSKEFDLSVRHHVVYNHAFEIHFYTLNIYVWMPFLCKVLYQSGENSNETFQAKVPQHPFKRHLLSTYLRQAMHSVLEIRNQVKLCSEGVFSQYAISGTTTNGQSNFVLASRSSGDSKKPKIEMTL